MAGSTSSGTVGGGSGLGGGLVHPTAFSVTPSDTDADPSGPFAALWVGGAGNVKVHTKGGQDVTYIGVPAGSYLAVECSRVWSTGTTATSILGLSGKFSFGLNVAEASLIP